LSFANIIKFSFVATLLVHIFIVLFFVFIVVSIANVLVSTSIRVSYTTHRVEYQMKFWWCLCLILFW